MPDYSSRFVQILGPACVCLLAGCNSINGAFSVAAPMTVNTTRNVESSPFCATEPNFDCDVKMVEESMALPPGNYTAALGFDDERVMSLSLKVNDVPREVRFDIPPSVRVPRQDGHFTLSSKDIGQPLNLAGSVSTEITVSPPRRAVEFCSYVIERRTCPGRLLKGGDKAKEHRHRGHAHGGSAGGKKQCGYRSFRVQGTQPVEFQFEDTKRTVALHLSQHGGGIRDDSFSDMRAGRHDRTPTNAAPVVVARFAGTQRSRRKIVRYRGDCF